MSSSFACAAAADEMMDDEAIEMFLLHGLTVILAPACLHLLEHSSHHLFSFLRGFVCTTLFSTEYTFLE